MSKVVIFIEGGVVHDVIADEELEVMILDYDTEGGEAERVSTVDSREVYVTQQNAVVNPKEIQKIENQIN